jgi:hypothetical protein
MGKSMQLYPRQGSVKPNKEKLEKKERVRLNMTFCRKNETQYNEKYQ